MGARAHMVPRLQEFLPSELALGYVGRPERASPAEGYPSAHDAEQVRIVRVAVDTSVAVSNVPSRPPGER